MWPALPEASKWDHQEVQFTFIDSYAKYTRELLDWSRSPQNTSGSPTLMVSVTLVEPGLEKSVTPIQLNSQNQQEVMVAVQKGLDT